MKAITLPMPIGALVIDGAAALVCYQRRHPITYDLRIGIGHPPLWSRELHRSIERYTDFQRLHPAFPPPLDWYDSLTFNSLVAVGDLVSVVPFDSALLSTAEAMLQDPKRYLVRFENVRKLDAPIHCKQQAGQMWDYDESTNAPAKYFPLPTQQIADYYDLCRQMLAGDNDPDVNARLFAEHPGCFILHQRYRGLRSGIIEWSEGSRGVQRVNRLTWWQHFKRYFPEFWRTR